jgi:hypothetical protein
MNERLFHAAIIAIAIGFTLLFVAIVVPPLIESGDILVGFAAGFVNPYSSGYSIDVIACWLILAIWVAFEASSKGVKHGWLCVVVGVVPGVAVGFAAYLILRARQQTDAHT